MMVRMETMGVGFCPNGEQRQIHRLWDQSWRILGCSGGGETRQRNAGVGSGDWDIDPWVKGGGLAGGGCSP